MWVRENEVGEIAIRYRGQRLHFREVPASTERSRGRGLAHAGTFLMWYDIAIHRAS